MLFRPLELSWNYLQKGFSFFTFAFPDDSYYALFAVVRLSDCNGWWVSIFFNAFLFAPEEYIIELEDEEDD